MLKWVGPRQRFHLNSRDSSETVSDVIMTARWELTAFERRMVVGARRMQNFISEIIRGFPIPRSIMSRVYREHLISGITSHHEQLSFRPCALNYRDQ
ncbi:transposable element Tc1 transposase [Trichonephila clavipes]|nr:transposable element Tc1 transposase [Trichonephila clavipes]